MYSIKQAQLLMGALPMADVTIYYINIRSFGKGFEEFYEQAKGMGINFVKGKIGQIDELENGDLKVRFEDINQGKLVESKHDLVVLSVGAMANEDPKTMFKADTWKQDEFAFAQQKDLFYTPSLSSIDGVFLAGTTSGPMDIPDTILSSGAASMEAIRYIKQAKVEI
jgi:heterodisulfide reductase subunit A